MYVVGLTGGIGSGKSTVANAFSSLGLSIIDADQIARDLVSTGSPALSEITSHFGDRIVDQAGKLDRSKLRAIIFNDQHAKRWLEALLHPLIQLEAKRQIAQVQGPYCIYEAALLLENKLADTVNRVLVIDVPKELQLTRASQRDDCSEDIIQHIIDSQMSRYERLAHADDIIDNSASPEALDNVVSQLHKHYLRLATIHNQEIS